MIIRLDFKTKRALNGLRVCGNMNVANLRTIITQNRFNTLKKEGIIRKSSYQDKHISRTKNQTTYCLTKKGQELCKKNGLTHFVKSKGSERHNEAVASIYCSLPADQQLQCQNQFDQRADLYEQACNYKEDGYIEKYEEKIEQINNASFLDLVVKTETSIIAFEVITKNYTTTDIEQHEYTATQILESTEYNVVNIN